MIITSKSNSLIKEIKKLSDKKYRKLCGQYIVEGIKPVSECISAGCEIDRIVCTEELFIKYPQATVVSDSVFSALTDEKAPQGVLAIVKMPENELIPPKNDCILLDGIQDPGNLGTIIRTANAAGYKELYLINCTDPYSPKAVRASMSGIFFVKIYQSSADGILEVLKGCSLICADMDGVDVFDFQPGNLFCLCIGNEGNGISATVKSCADDVIKIPMDKNCESLNAAVSAGIAMYILKRNKVR